MPTCIIVDDDELTINVFSELLELIGLQVLGKGRSGSEAVSLFRGHRPDVIFTDIMMPNTDGFYAIKNIKQIDPDAKIVVVTADLTSDTQERLNSMNVSAIIYKPFVHMEIKQVLLQEYKINTL